MMNYVGPTKNLLLHLLGVKNITIILPNDVKM